jgi:hypothetical protein
MDPAGIAAFGTLSQDGSYYAVADYRLRHGSLPFGWVAMLAQLCWAPAITLGGLAFLLFPDGSLPSPRWRWMLWIYLTWAALFTGGALALTIGAAVGHDIHVGAGGDLLILDHPTTNTIRLSTAAGTTARSARSKRRACGRRRTVSGARRPSGAG